MKSECADEPILEGADEFLNTFVESALKLSGLGTFGAGTFKCATRKAFDNYIIDSQHNLYLS